MGSGDWTVVEVLHGSGIQRAVDKPRYMHVAEDVEHFAWLFADGRLPLLTDERATELVGLCIEPAQQFAAL